MSGMVISMDSSGMAGPDASVFRAELVLDVDGRGALIFSSQAEHSTGGWSGTLDVAADESKECCVVSCPALSALSAVQLSISFSEL
jgi:hypothetical protein